MNMREFTVLDGSSDIILKSNDYFLSDGGNFKLVKANNKFILTTNPSGAYMKFVRSKDGIVNALTINRIRDNDTLTRLYKKIK